jgi:hypothetical protein
MARRMKGNPRIAQLQDFSISNPLGRYIPKPVAHNRQSRICGQICPHPPARVVRMSMGDQGAFNRTPGINVEIPGRAIDAFFGKGKDGRFGHRMHLSRQKQMQRASSDKARWISARTLAGDIAQKQLFEPIQHRGAHAFLFHQDFMFTARDHL